MIPKTRSDIFNEGALAAFLKQHAVEDVVAMAQDSSLRRYYRGQRRGLSVIVMESVCDDSPYAMGGHGLSDFVALSGWLNEVGLKAPEIYEADLAGGYLLLEDFGDESFKVRLNSGYDAAELYGLGAEVLAHIAQAGALPDLPLYSESHVHRNHSFIVEHYLPYASDVSDVEAVRAEYLKIWAEIEDGLPPCPQGFVHVDFHAENLMWLPEEVGLKRCGILDFQGAMKGPLPYDLANLLEDARYDVPEDVRLSILSGFDADFRSWYRVLATQFHCRVIGQFIKMAVEGGNLSYLQHIPRLESYLRAGLCDPLLKPLKIFFEDIGLDFFGARDLNDALFRNKGE